MALWTLAATVPDTGLGAEPPPFATPASGYKGGVLCVGPRRGGRFSAAVGWRHEAMESDANNGKRSAS
jgi:hypothetical protein